VTISSETILVTTALEESWGKDEYIVFLGEWCKKYSRKHVWQFRKSRTHTYHWADRTKLAQDHDLVKESYERTLTWLSGELNRLHNVNHSKRYWRIVLGPWLMFYMHVVWNRWEEIRRVLDDHKEISTLIPKDEVSAPIAKDFEMAQKLGFSDEWNYLLFLDILKNLNAGQVNFREVSISLNFDLLMKESFKVSLKTKIAIFIDRLVGSLNFKNSYRVVIYDGYFPLGRLILCFLKIGQLPRLFREFTLPIDFLAPDYPTRKKFKHSNSAISDFEKFLIDKIPLDLPIAYLEGYGFTICKSCNDCKSIRRRII